jgi:hypothetical protein
MLSSSYSFVLYCKSYNVDVLRVQRLAKTIAQFNVDNIPFYVSVPLKDLPLFQEKLNDFDVHLITDEFIIQSNPAIDPQALSNIPGHISQQVVKSEFWRLGISDAYMCLDSDCMFIRPFHLNDYVCSNGIPYTVMDEGKDLLEFSLSAGKPQLLNNFQVEATRVQNVFEREGRHYSFGPFPLVWHSKVWKSLDTQYLKPNSMSFLDAIQFAPFESRWYGEALLAFKAIPLMPCQAFFKVYHYAKQFDNDRRNNVNLEMLSKIYSGVIFQSAWERDMDWPNEGGSGLSKLARRLRRSLGRT